MENSNDGPLSAQQTAVAKMAQDEFELSEVRLITEDQLPPLDDRVYPRPSLIKYKWVLCTCFEHDWKILRSLADIGRVWGGCVLVRWIQPLQ